MSDYDNKFYLERFIGNGYNNALMRNIIHKPWNNSIINQWLKAPSGFLLLIGCPGSGKTFASVAFSRYLWDKIYLHRLRKIRALYPEHEGKDLPSHLAPKIAREVCFLSQADILRETKKEMGARSGGDLATILKNTLVLTIDDFGATRNNEWQQETMQQILEERYNSRRPTILSSNLTLAEMGSQFHPRVASRLGDRNNVIIEEWDRDLRQDGV